MKNNYALIAEVFKKRRKLLGYSKKKLASLVGISDTELSRIEHSERENYNLVTLIKMCETLKIDFIDLLVVAGYLPAEKKEQQNNFYLNEKFFNSQSKDVAYGDGEPIVLHLSIMVSEDKNRKDRG